MVPRLMCSGALEVHLTMVTSFGVRQNAYSGKVQSFVMLDDLFA